MHGRDAGVLGGLVLTVLGQFRLAAHDAPFGIALTLGGVALVLATVRSTEPRSFAGSSGGPAVTATGTNWELGLAAGVLSACATFLLPLPEAPPLFWLAFVGSVALAIVAASGDGPVRVRRPRLPSARGDRRWLLAAAVVVLVAAALRLYHLDRLPEGVWFDEAQRGIEARRLLHEPGYHPLWISTRFSEPALHTWLVAGSFLVFGETVFAIRAVSAAFGIVAVVAALAVGRRWFGRRGGLVFGVIVAASRFEITFGRIGMFNSTTTAVLLGGLALGLRGLEQRRRRTLLGAGLVLGAGFHFYSGAVPGIIGVLGVLFVTGGWARRRDLIMVVAGLLVVAAPILSLSVREPDLVFGRTRQASVFRQTGGPDGADAVIGNTGRYLLEFQWEGDRNGRHDVPGDPVLDRVTAALAVIGLGVLAVNARRRLLPWVLVGWFALGLVPGILSLTFEAPNSLRVYSSFVAGHLIAGFGAAAVLDRVRVRGRNPLALGLSGALLALGAGTYFGRWQDDGSAWAAHSTSATVAGRVLAASGADRQVLIDSILAAGPSVEFLAESRRPDTVIQPDDPAILPLDPGRPATVVLDAVSTGLVERLVARYGATVEERARSGIAAAYVLEIPADAIAARQGLRISFTGLDRPPQMEPDLDLEPDEQPAGATGVAIDAVLLTGAEADPSRDPMTAYRFVGPPGRRLTIDGVELVDLDRPFELGRGAHAMSASSPLGERIALEMQVGDEWQLVPPSRFAPDTPVEGLVAELTTADPAAPGARQRWLDGALDYRVQIARSIRPARTVWSGWLVVEDGGTYRMRLGDLDPTTLTIDGKLIGAATDLRAGTLDAEVALGAGWHRIRIEQDDATDETEIHFAWAKAGEDLVAVDGAALRPPWAEPPT